MKTKQNKRTTYKNFDLAAFKHTKHEMKTFMQNCFGEDMFALWDDLAASYMPRRDERNVRQTYTLEADGTAIPDRLFMGEDDGLYDFHEPLIGIKVHSALSILANRTPDVRWESDNYLYERKVPIINAQRDKDWEDEQTRSQYVMLWFFFVMFGTTFWRRFYFEDTREVQAPVGFNLETNEIEYRKAMLTEMSQTVGEAISPRDILIDPNTQPMKPRSMKSVIYSKYYTRPEFRAEFKGKISRKKMKEALKMSSVPATDNPAKDKTSVDSIDRIRVDFLEDERLDLYYAVVNDELEIIKSPLPYKHKRISVMMASWMPRNERNPFGLGPIEMALPDKEAVDEFKSMTFSQAKFSIFKSLFYQGSFKLDGMDASEVTIQPNKAYKASNTRDLKFYDMPGPGADAWRGLEALRNDVDAATGITKPLAGQITKATAFETDLAKDAALSRLSIPIKNIVNLLAQDAERTLELHDQYYTVEEVREILDPADVLSTIEHLEFFEQNNIPVPFTITVEDGDTDEPRILVGRKRTGQFGLMPTADGSLAPSDGKVTVIYEADTFKWKGKIRIVEDSLLSITPTIERTKKLELYNMVAPMFAQPPELYAKTAKVMCDLFGEDYREILPENFVAYIEQLNRGRYTRQQLGAQADEAQQFAQTGEGPGSPASFEQQRAPRVVTNVGGQRDSRAAASQAFNQQNLSRV